MTSDIASFTWAKDAWRCPAQPQTSSCSLNLLPHATCKAATAPGPRRWDRPLQLWKSSTSSTSIHKNTVGSAEKPRQSSQQCSKCRPMELRLTIEIGTCRRHRALHTSAFVYTVNAISPLFGDSIWIENQGKTHRTAPALTPPALLELPVAPKHLATRRDLQECFVVVAYGILLRASGTQLALNSLLVHRHRTCEDGSWLVTGGARSSCVLP